jgi:hypothetical protein
MESRWVEKWCFGPSRDHATVASKTFHTVSLLGVSLLGASVNKVVSLRIIRRLAFGCEVCAKCQGKRVKEETMPGDGSTEELGFSQKRIIDGFDEVAKGLAAGAISRRRALKLTGAALLSGGLLALFPGVAGAQNSTGCQGRPAINNRVCPETNCRDNPDCLCATTVAGNKRCVNLANEVCPATDECDRNRDCPNDEVCIRIGGCCGRPRRNLCVPLCVSGPGLP